MRENELIDERILRQYLLGELPEAEAERLEREMLADDALFDLAEALEADLLDAAARGDLAPAERDRVLAHLAGTAAGRSRLALARDLATVAHKRTVVPFPSRIAAAAPAWLRAAAAACLVLVLGWLLVPQVIPPEAPETAVIDVSLVVPRDAGTAPKPTVIGPRVGRITLRVNVSAELQTRFRVTVRSARNGALMDSQDLNAQAAGGGARVVMLKLDARRLPSGSYDIEVDGLDGGTPRLLGVPRIEIERKVVR